MNQSKPRQTLNNQTSKLTFCSQNLHQRLRNPPSRPGQEDKKSRENCNKCDINILSQKHIYASFKSYLSFESGVNKISVISEIHLSFAFDFLLYFISRNLFFAWSWSNLKPPPPYSHPPPTSPSIFL